MPPFSRLLCLITVTLIFSCYCRGQNAVCDSVQLFETQLNISEDSLMRQLARSRNRERVDLLGYLTFYYAFNNPQTGLSLGTEGISLSERLKYKRGTAYCNQSMSFCLMIMGNYNSSLRFALKALRQYEELQDYPRIAYNYLQTANIYRETGDFKKALFEASQGIRINDSIGFNQKVAYAVIGSIYERANQLDSALKYIQKAYEMDLSNNGGRWGWLTYILANVHDKLKHEHVAISYYHLAAPLVIAENNLKDYIDVYNSLSSAHRNQGRIDSCVFYANQVVYQRTSTDYTQGILKAVNMLADVYKEEKRTDSVIKYLEMSVALNQILFTADKEREFQNLSFNEALRRQENEQEKRRVMEERTRNLQYLLIAAFIITVAIGVIMLSSNRSMLKPARFLALICLLLIFEFISLLTHPLIERITNHNPVWSLLILVLLASALIPAHHTLENLIKSRLTAKRRRRGRG